MNARPKKTLEETLAARAAAGRSWRPQRSGNRKEEQHDLGNLLLFL